MQHLFSKWTWCLPEKYDLLCDWQVDFHDTGRGLRVPSMTDYFGFTLAAMNEKGSVFANPKKGDKIPSTIMYRPFNSWTNNSEVNRKFFMDSLLLLFSLVWMPFCRFGCLVEFLDGKRKIVPAQVLERLAVKVARLWEMMERLCCWPLRVLCSVVDAVSSWRGGQGSWYW